MARSLNRCPALFFIVAVLVIGSPSSNPGQTTDSSGASEVVLYFNVTDKYGRFVTHLTKENFKVQDGDNVHLVTSFGFEDSPVSVGFLIDTSLSAEYLTEYSFDSLPPFMKACADGSDFFVMSFAEEPRLLVDWKTSAGEVLQELRGLTIKTKGGTGLFDAIDRGIAKVADGKSHKKALIVFSDGMDSISKLRAKDIGRKLGATEIILYNVGLGNSPGLRTMTGVQAAQGMSELTSMSGGRILLPHMSEFDNVMLRTAGELRYQYRIGFRASGAPAGKRDNDRRKIEVKVVLPPDLAKKIGKLSVQRRNAYRVNPSSTK